MSQGTLQDVDGRVYTGQFKNGKANGYGKMWYLSAYYDGYWADGKHNGFAEIQYDDGSFYRGQWKDNQYHGTGVYFDTYTFYVTTVKHSVYTEVEKELDLEL